MALRYVAPSEIVNWPTTLGGQGQNLQPADAIRKLLRITDPVSTGLGSPQTVHYVMLPGQPAILSGDHIAVEPEVFGRTEAVVVSEVTGMQLFSSYGGTFKATFNEAHDLNAICTTAPYPNWIGSQRSMLVILRAGAAISPVIRQRIAEQLQRQNRAVTVWGVVQQLSPGMAGPYTLNLSPLNATPLGVVTYPI